MSARDGIPEEQLRSPEEMSTEELSYEVHLAVLDGDTAPALEAIGELLERLAGQTDEDAGLSGDG